MGGGSSTANTTNIRTKAIVDAMARSIMNCKGNTQVTQRFVLSGSYNVIDGYKMVQNFKLSTSCANKAENLADIQQSVAGAVKAQAAAQSVTLTGALGGSSSEVNTTIENEVRQTITNETVTNVINDVNALQESIISGDHNIINNFSMEQTFDLVSEACQDVLNTMKSVQAVTNNSDTKSEATQKDFVAGVIDSVGNIFTSMGTMWVIVAVVALVVGGYIVVKGGPAALFGSSGSDGQPAQPGLMSLMQQQQPQMQQQFRPPQQAQYQPPPPPQPQYQPPPPQPQYQPPPPQPQYQPPPPPPQQMYQPPPMQPQYQQPPMYQQQQYRPY